MGPLLVVRSYLGYYTGSHQNSAVKRPWARIVLGWVTSREVLVLHPPLSSPLLLWFGMVLGWVTMFGRALRGGDIRGSEGKKQ